MTAAFEQVVYEEYNFGDGEQAGAEHEAREPPEGTDGVDQRVLRPLHYAALQHGLHLDHHLGGVLFPELKRFIRMLLSIDPKVFVR